MTEPAFRIIGSFEIAKLELKADDVLVVRVDRPISMDVAERIRKHISPLLPQGVKTLVINPEIELSVLSRSDIESKVA